ncbi:DUF998 domain-containing protein [Kribbella capetownensis]|uniref:DUF998 domain-containing protein n=1 Tax=Kribbella capetownensis TaxID=1572659 RepID=A0A4R0JDL2_9ACTN|nr:DUF998 domain-containing protein [Kribbella capetownensis]TCC44000.1 DUF998 domain-containing protein [Kribbella capetownensis]
MTTNDLTVPTTTRISTRALLTGGIVAGPLYVAVWLGQAFTREGFDITRHPASLLANGGPGWIQTLNFVVSGLLSIGAAVGLRRTLTGRGSTWGPRLLVAYGVGLLLAAIFKADPASGFPAGTPADYAEISSRGVGHFVAGGIGFSGLIAACLVLAVHFRSVGRRALSRFSAITGVLFFGAFAGLSAGAGSRPTIIAFDLAVTLAWIWLTVICTDERRGHH